MSIRPLLIAAALAVTALSSPAVAQKAPSAQAFTKLEGCRLLPHKSNDGDSFHVMHEGKEYIFR